MSDEDIEAKSAKTSGVTSPCKRCIVTLVHGTWGRGIFPRDYNSARGAWRLRFPFRLFLRAPAARWFDPTASFHQTLQALGCEVRSFAWTGANSVFERARAARNLAELLKSDPPDMHSVIIAHSHGGNVALKALSDSRLNLAPFQVITLATPFIHVFPRWFNPSFGSALWPTLLCVIQLVTYSGYALSASFSWFQGTRLWFIDYAMIAGAVLLPSLIVSVFTTRFLFNPGPPRNIIGNERERPWLWRPFRIARAVNYVSDSEHGPKILVLRGVDDEAGLGLTFGLIGARLSHEVRNLIERKIFIWIVIALPLLDYIVSRMRGTNFAALFVTTIPPIMLGLIFLPGVFYSVFGREFAFGAVRCELSANSSPDSERVKVVTLPLWDTDILGGLRHSIYNHPDCLPQILLWLLEEEVLDNFKLKFALKMMDLKRRTNELIRSKGGGDPVAEGGGVDELLEGMSNVLDDFIDHSTRR